MTIEPVGYRIIISFEDIQEIDPLYKKMKEMKFAIPESEDKNRRQASMDKGYVLALGSKVEFAEGIKVGDYIGYARHSGKVITEEDDDSKKYMIINDEDVLCIFRRGS